MTYERNPAAPGDSASGLQEAYDEQRFRSTAESEVQELRSSIPGDIGALAQYFYSFAHYPDENIAIAGAITVYAGIVGKTYNTSSGAGLNVYTLFLAPTGVGKDTIKNARSRLFLEIARSVPSIDDFKGPGELGSAQGLIRWLEKRPCCASIFGEFAPTLKKITSPNANPNDEGIARQLLAAYSSSGYGSTIDPIAYSDRDKNTATIYGASYSIFAESVPERVYENFNEGLIASGLLPRFDVWETNNPRPYINRNRIGEPPPALVQKLADLAAYCQTQSNLGNVILPTYGPGAEAKLYEFEAWATDAINASNEVARQLWNRAYLKALKLATLYAVGVNYLAPVVTLDAVIWATNLVVAQTRHLLGKFANGDVGAVEGNEAKQIDEVVKVIGSYVHSEYSRYEKYGGSFEMHRDGVIIEAHIQRRLITLKTFKPKPTEAIKRALKSLLDADELREMPKSQMIQNYGTGPRAFVISNPGRFRQRV